MISQFEDWLRLPSSILGSSVNASPMQGYQSLNDNLFKRRRNILQ
jgi:hypothetical protein